MKYYNFIRSVLADRSLSFRQREILLALYSYADQDMKCFPKRQALAEMLGTRVSEISRITSELVDKKWLSKEGKGGFSKSCFYTITVQKTCTVDVDKETTVQKNSTVQKTCTKTVQKTCTRNKEPIEESNIPPLYPPQGGTSFSDSPEQKAIPKNKKTKTRTSRKRKQSQKPKITKVIYGMQTQEIQLCLHLINLKGPTSRFPSKGIQAPEERLLALQNWAVDFHEILKLYDFETIKAMLDFAFSENRQGHVVQAPSKLLAKLKDENNSFLDLFSLSQKPKSSRAPRGSRPESRKMNYQELLNQGGEELVQKPNRQTGFWEKCDQEQRNRDFKSSVEPPQSDQGAKGWGGFPVVDSNDTRELERFMFPGGGRGQYADVA